jgi:hypothetical protein
MLINDATSKIKNNKNEKHTHSHTGAMHFFEKIDMTF